MIPALCAGSLSGLSSGDETCCRHAEKPTAQRSRLVSEGAERRRRGADFRRIAGPAGDDDGPAEQCKDNRACRYAEPAEAARPLASLASHLFDIEIALQSAGDRCVDLLHGEADEAEPLPVPARVLLILWRLSELVLWK